MSKKPGEQPKIRVVEEEPSQPRVVVLGADGPVIRLGGEKLAPEPKAPVEEPEVLEVGNRSVGDVRSVAPTIEEILDGEEAESPEVPLEDSWGGEAKHWLGVPWGWFVLVALICSGFALWSVRHLFVHRHVNQLVVSRTVEMVEADMRLGEQAEVLYQRLEERIIAYLGSATVEERLQHVRHPERVEPLMRQWYAGQALVPEKFVGLEAFQPLTLENRPFWAVGVRTDTGKRSLLLEQTDGDDGLIDWETDVHYQPIPWDRYMAERPEGVFDFRLNVGFDNYYAYEFSDEGNYRCFRLMTPSSDRHLFGYVRRGSPEEREIVSLLRRGGLVVPLILGLEFVAGGEARDSVKITRVMSRRWAYLAPPGE